MATAAAPTQVPTRPRWLAPARRRPVLAVAALYAVLSLAMFLPGMVPGRTLSPSDYLWTSTPWAASRPEGVPILGSNREQTDAVKMFQPWLEETRRRLPDLPLWDPYIMGGRPLQANTQSAVFSPFSVPTYVLGLWSSLALVAALKVFLAALGTFFFARLLGMRLAAACFAGVVFGFSLWCVSWVSWTTMSVWACLPLVLALGEVLLRRPGPLPFAGLAVLIGLQWFGGHPATNFQVLVPVVVFWGVRLLLAREERWRPALRRAAWLGGALAAGTALAAVLLIPFLELLRESIDLQERSAHPEHQLTHYLLGVFLPDYWGRSTRGTLIEFPSALEERAYYLGALPLMLAVVALLRPTRGRVTAAAGALVALAVATGIPPFYQLVSHTPGFSGTNTWRLAVFTVLGGALLAAWGLEDLMRPAADARRRRVVTAVCAGLLVLPLLVVVAAGGLRLDRAGEAVRMAWAFAEPDPAGAFTDRASFVGVVRLSALLEWLLPAAVAVVVVVLRLRGRLSATAFAAVAVVVVALDLFRAGMGYNPAIPRSHATQPATGAIRFLQSRRPERFVGLDPAIPLAVPVLPNVATRYGLLDARGYDFPVERRYAELWRGAIAREPACNYAFCVGSVGIRPAAFRALGLFGVTHLVQTPRTRPCPACASPTRAATPASTRTPTPCRARFSSATRRSSRAPTRPAPPSPRPASGAGRPP